MPDSHQQRRSTHPVFAGMGPRQLQRIRRFFTACWIPLGYAISLLIFFSIGLLQGRVLVLACVLLITGCAAYGGIFLIGWNQKLLDKNMTSLMSLSMVCLMLFICYLNPLTQITYAPFALLIMLASAFRLRHRQLFVMATVILVGDVLVICIQYFQGRLETNLTFSLSNASILALTLPGFVFMSSKIRRLYRSLYMVSIKMESIEEHARRDELTGCFNRRYMMAALQEQKHLADGSDQNLCLAVVDLDHFKRINDDIGHLAGDEVLRTFAKLAQQNIRSEDIFGRYGGEEFLLLLPGVELLDALNTVERIRALTETKLNILAKIERKVTVSIGLTQYIPGESVLDLFSRGDVAMYMAKSGGRNQVMVKEFVETLD
jgi:diguanylate cyclase (GGDEF)-like protein